MVITGLCDSWKGQERWTEENLVRQYGEHKFKVCQEQLRIRYEYSRGWSAIFARSRLMLKMSVPSGNSCKSIRGASLKH